MIHATTTTKSASAELPKAPNLYEEVAGKISHLIRHGTFADGDRIPSVRKLSQEFDVSITTVLEAYRLLENRGLIEARPQSGYYVRPRIQALRIRETESPEASGLPVSVSIDRQVMRILKDCNDPKIYQLGAAVPNPDLLPVEKLNRTMAAIARRLGKRSAVYDFPPGCPALRHQIAQRALVSGCSLTSDEIVTTFGAQEAITLALRATCEPGDTVAVESPTYYGFLQMIEVLGLRALEIPSHPRTGISLEALRLAMDTNRIRACLVIPSFNNPQGCCVPEENRRKLVNMLAERDIPLIEDDIYGELHFAQERSRVCKAFDEKGHVLLVSSFSKTLAPGYRVGWIAAGRYQDKIERLKMTSTMATATLPQLAIADFLANGGYDHHLRAIRKTYSHQIAKMAQAVSRHLPEGTGVSQPDGGFILWVELPPKVDTMKIYDHAVSQGFNFAPGPIFSAKQRFRNCIRVSCARWSDRAEESIAKLGKIVAERM